MTLRTKAQTYSSLRPRAQRLERSKKRLKAHRYRSVQTRLGKRDRNDDLAREYVKLEYDFCVTCGSTDEETLECAHIFSRVRWSTRWLPRNLCRQCSKCNQEHEGNPKPLMKWAIDKYTVKGVDDLFDLWNTKRVLTDIELDLIAEDLKRLIADLKRDRELMTIF